MATIQKMIDDLELRIYGGKPSDDAEIPREQMRKWLEDANAAILPDWIAQKNYGEIPAIVTKSFDCIMVNAEESECIDGCSSKYYLDLPKNSDGETIRVLDLSDDGGIITVLQGRREIYGFGSAGASKVRKNIRFAEKFPYFYRIGSKVYLFNGVYPPYSKFTLVVACIDTTIMDETEPFPAPQAAIGLILDAAYETATKELGRQDLVSDGKDIQTNGNNVS